MKDWRDVCSYDFLWLEQVWGQKSLRFLLLHWDSGEKWRLLREEMGKNSTGPMPQAHQPVSKKLVPWEIKEGRFHGHHQILVSPRFQHELGTSRDPQVRA